jgi:hypothetical protein
MAYQNNIPLPNDLLSVSQGDLNANFMSIYTWAGVNHVLFDAVGQGKHNFVSMPVQMADPGTTATELALYTKTSLLSGNPEAFFQRQSNGAAIEFTSSLAATSGWTRLPSGIMLKWGQFAANPGANTVIYTGNAAAGSTFANVFSVLLTPVGTNCLFSYTSTTNLQFIMNSGAAVITNFNYFAIGN